MRGTIASISSERGSGAITPDEEGGEIAFGQNALHSVELEDLTVGVAVEFTLGHEAGASANEGLRAVDVRLADDPPPAEDNESFPANRLGTV